MTNPFIQQLAEICRTRPTRANWAIVPSHGIGHTLGDRLVRNCTDWANLRFVTPLNLALRMAGPFLVERGINPSEDTLGPALMIRLMLDLPAEHGYFKPIAEQPSMGQALWSTLYELRMTGVRDVGITTVLIGRDIAIATVPGEPLHRLQTMWKQQADVPNALFYGYTVTSTGGWAGYVPDLRSAAYGGYGADVSTSIEVGAGEKIMLRHLTNLYDLKGMWFDKPGRR